MRGSWEKILRAAKSWPTMIVAAVALAGAVTWATGWDVQGAVRDVIPVLRHELNPDRLEIAQNTRERLTRSLRSTKQDLRDVETDILRNEQRGDPVPPRWTRSLKRYNEDIRDKSEAIDQQDQKIKRYSR